MTGEPSQSRGEPSQPELSGSGELSEQSLESEQEENPSQYVQESLDETETAQFSRRIEQLKQAHTQWLAAPEPRGRFNANWLEENGFSGLYQWAHMKVGGVTKLVALTGGAVADDFEYREHSEARTEASAMADLIHAHAVWLQSPEPRRKFNVQWLTDNSFSGLYQWARRKGGGIERLLEKVGGLVAEDFDIKYSEESVQEALRAAHEKWLNSPQPRGSFNARWLTLNGFNRIYDWSRRNAGGLDKLVEKVGDAVAQDFEYQQWGYSHESAQMKLREAYAQWLRTPEPRSKFNGLWLVEHGYGGLCNWARNKGGGLVELVAQTGGDIARDFEYRERGAKYTHASAQRKLTEAHTQWLALSEPRGMFNAEWLTEHGYGGLSRWAQEHEGLLKLAEQAGGGVARDITYKEQPNQYTVESVQKQLIEAHAQWLVSPEPRGAFNGTWLTNNGCKGIYEWSNRRGGGFVELVEQIGGDVARDFSYRENPRQYTHESAQAKLKDAYAQWLSSSQPRDSFNGNWLRKNGYEGLRVWTGKHGGLLPLVQSTGGGIAEDFEYLESYNDASAQSKFKEAHAQWLESPEPKGAFNTGWLQGNGYSGLERWARQNGGLRQLAEKTGAAAATDFEYQEQTADYTTESVLEKFRQAHADWVATPEPRRTFNGVWLERNGYDRLYNWARKQSGSLPEFAKKAGGDVARDFEYRERRQKTPDEGLNKEQTAALARRIEQLQQAHAKWLRTPEPRDTFNAYWLEGNGYSGLCQWAKTIGGLPTLVAATGGTAVNDFKYREPSSPRTEASAIADLIQAHAKWLALSEPRPKFHGRWMRDNGYSGLERWARTKGVELSEMVRNIGGDVAKDFEFDRTVDSAREELRAAHAKWLMTTEPRETFNGSWLKAKGFSGLYAWAVENGGIKELIQSTGSAIVTDFQYQERTLGRTQASALEELQEAHAEWLTTIELQGAFTSKWLSKHGYRGLDKWIREHGGVAEFVKLAAAVGVNFEYREQYTDASAQEKLAQAHAQWLATSDPRDKFNGSWLYAHGYSGLTVWARKHGGLHELVKKVGGDVVRDFELRANPKSVANGEKVADEIEAQSPESWIDSATADELTETSPSSDEDVFMGGTPADGRTVDFSTLDVFESTRGFQTTIDTTGVLESDAVGPSEPVPLNRGLSELMQGMTLTGAERLRLLIGQNGDKWQRPEQARLYAEYVGQLPSYVVHRARITYLQQYFAKHNLPFPSPIADLGAGPSVGYQAYQELFQRAGLEPPSVIDIDSSQAMLDAGLNKQRLFANIAKHLPVTDGRFAMVESSYAIHHFSESEILQTLKEANRATQLGGYLNLTSPVRFSQTFLQGLQQLGYELLSQYGERLALTEGAERVIDDRYGHTVAQRMKDKLRSSFIVLARKQRSVTQSPDASLFTFERTVSGGGSLRRSEAIQVTEQQPQEAKMRIERLTAQISDVLDRLRNFTARGVAQYRLPISPLEEWDYKHGLKGTVKQLGAELREIGRSTPSELAGELGIAQRLLKDLEDARHMKKEEWYEYQAALRSSSGKSPRP